MLAQVRLVDGLVVDAGVGGDDIHAPQGRDQLAFLDGFAGILAQALAVREIHAARIGGGADYAARAAVRFRLEPGQAAVAHHLDVAHHVDVADRHEAPGAPELAHFHLVGERPAGGLAALAAEDLPLLGRQLHRPTPPCRGSG